MDAAKRRLVGLGVLLISLALLGWAVWPTAREQRTLEIAPQELRNGVTGETGQPDGRLTLEWPQALKVGERGTIRLQLESSPVMAGEVPAYNRLVVARLEIAGLQPAPAGEVSEPLPPGQAAVLNWSVQPQVTGTYPGTLWVALRFVPQGAGEAAPARRVLSAQRLELRATSLLGLGLHQARLFGAAGAILGALVFLETFLVRYWRPSKES